jgi:transcriptional regulator with XRE-family HTH domain
MKDIRPNISKNLAKLRKDKGLTQAELAEKLSYSDKAVSRWEHGDTLPDVNVLYELCEFYGITLNDLVSEECYIEEAKEKKRAIKEMKLWRCILAGVIIWLLATVVFMYTLALDIGNNTWVMFIIAAPVSMIFFYIFGKGLFNNLTSFILFSCIMWLIITAVYFVILVFASLNFWQIFIVGVPVEVIIFLTFKMRGLPKIKEIVKK